jgi:hypothetical protein
VPVRAIRQRLPEGRGPATHADGGAPVAAIQPPVPAGATTVTESRAGSEVRSVVLPRVAAPAGASPDLGAGSYDAGSVFHAASIPLPAEGGPFFARPAPTRSAVLGAFQQAMRSPAVAPQAAARRAAQAGPAAAALGIATPLPAPVAAPLMRPATLARVADTAPARVLDAAGQSAPAPAPAAPAPDLDALADYVLERLRHELRDGRERLGYLLDDTR